MIHFDKVSMAVVAICSLKAPLEVQSFAIVTGTTGRRPSSLKLVPAQASQLVAAQNCIQVKKSQDEEELPLLSSILFDSARDLVGEMFSLSSLGLRRRESADAGEGCPHEGTSITSVFPPALFEYSHRRSKKEEQDDDVVLYPVLGFRWIAVDRPEDALHKRYEILPTSIKASMPIADAHRREEEVVGWFSPACRLGTLEEDDASYCGRGL